MIVGTVKGVFIFSSDRNRRQFHIAGPYFKGQAVFSTAYLPDKRAPRILVGHMSMHWGALVSWSDDFGASWHEPEDGNVKFPAGSGLSLNAVWALEPAPLIGPDVVFAGADPAALYRSDDRGETFHPVESLLNHPERPYWMPGVGGLCLHTILPDPRDPKRIIVGISSAGMYRSDDGGESWTRRNKGVRMEGGPPHAPHFGPQCAHKMRYDAKNPARIYLQNHPGVYRSDDGGDSWIDIAAGLPSEFGFPAGRPSEPRRYRVPDPARVRHLSRAARRRRQGLAHARRRRIMGAARRSDSHSATLLLGAARRVHVRQPRSRGTLFRHPRRPTVRVARRGRKLELDRGLAARGAVRESGRGRLSIVMLFHLPSALRRLAGDNEVVEMRLPLDVRMTIGEAFVMLGRDYPAIRQRVLDDQNNIRRHVNVFVNGENVRFAQGGPTQVSNDSEVWIYPALSGG